MSEIISHKELGEFLKGVRLELGLSQTKTATLSKSYPYPFSTSYISLVEQGKIKPTMNTLFTFSKILDIPLDLLTDLACVIHAKSKRNVKRTYKDLWTEGSRAIFEGRYMKALKIYEDSLATAKTEEEWFRGVINSSNAQMGLGMLNSAKFRAENALKKHHMKISDFGKRYALSVLSKILKRQGNYAIANSYAKESLNIATKMKDRKSEGIAYNLLGSICDLSEEYNSAMDYFDRAIELFNRIDDAEGYAITLANKGDLFINMKNYKKGMRLLYEADEILKETSFTFQKATNKLHLVKAHYILRDYESAMKIESETWPVLHKAGYHDLMFVSAFYRWKTARERADNEEEKRSFRLLQKLRERIPEYLPERKEFSKYVIEKKRLERST